MKKILSSFVWRKTAGKVRRENKREREREGEAFARINERVAQDAVSSVLPYPGDTHEAAHGVF